MLTENRKIVLIGTGMVGMSYAYALLNQSACDELILIDIDKERALGEAMDLNHGLAFSLSHMKIRAGDYRECEDAGIAVICAGAAQEPGESRLDLLQRNAAIFGEIIRQVCESGFNGLFLVATNPVDIMTQITCTLSGFNPRRVLGSGTALDTARLRYLLGERFSIDPRNIHAYVIGEHGDSEFVPWSQATLANRSLSELCEQAKPYCDPGDLERISDNVRGAAEEIIKAKRATYYGIGMALVRITKAIFSNENSILTVSALLRGEYGESGVFIGTPCIINRNGVRKVIELDLNAEERKKFSLSCRTLKEVCESLSLL